MAVMNRTLPAKQSPKFPAFAESRGAQNHNTRLKAPQEHPGRSSRATSGFVVAISKHVSRMKERCYIAWDTHCNE